MPLDVVDFYDSFKRSDSALFRTLAERITFVSSFEEGMQKSQEENSAYVYERLFMELMIVERFTDMDGSTSLYVAKENIMPGYAGWPMIRDAPFKQNIDKCIMAFHGAGLFSKWSSDILREARQDSRKMIRTNSAEEQNKEAAAKKDTGAVSGIMALTLTHMQGPFMLLGLGLLIASVIYALEVLTHRCTKSVQALNLCGGCVN